MNKFDKAWFNGITITIDSVTQQRIEAKVIYCSQGEQVVTGNVAMPYFI